MQYYTIKKTDHKDNFNEIDYNIFNWKIKNIITYMDSIRYINEQTILFLVEINENNYHFSINYINKKETNYWSLTFSDIIIQSNKTHLKILNMVDVINDKYIINDSKNQTIDIMLNIIEKVIEDFDFDEDEDEDEKEINNNNDIKHYYNYFDDSEADNFKDININSESNFKKTETNNIFNKVIKSDTDSDSEDEYKQFVKHLHR